jgi:flagellar protein FliL
MAEKIPADLESQSAGSSSRSAPPGTVIIQRGPSASTIFVVAVMALAGGGGGVWYLQHGRADASGGKAVEKAAETVVHLEGFTVNLADPEDNHFLRVTMDLGLERLPPPTASDKPNSGLPVARIRDSIMSVLTVCRADVLLTPQGKLQLKKSLLETLNHDNPELGVREIYFTEFLVQR